MMFYERLNEALAADPKKKGVFLFKANWPGVSGDRWIWARSRADAVARAAQAEGYWAERHHQGRIHEGEI